MGLVLSFTKGYPVTTSLVDRLKELANQMAEQDRPYGLAGVVQILSRSATYEDCQEAVSLMEKALDDDLV